MAGKYNEQERTGRILFSNGMIIYRTVAANINSIETHDNRFHADDIASKSIICHFQGLLLQ